MHKTSEGRSGLVLSPPGYPAPVSDHRPLLEDAHRGVGRVHRGAGDGAAGGAALTISYYAAGG